MRIVYMYIQSYGCIHEKGFLFDTNYIVNMSKKDDSVFIYVHKADKKVDDILYGNTSVNALVGENGVGKSTCLDALQSWLVDFDNNPGIVIWEQDKTLFYHELMKEKLHFESRLKIVKYTSGLSSKVCKFFC